MAPTPVQAGRGLAQHDAHSRTKRAAEVNVLDIAFAFRGRSLGKGHRYTCSIESRVAFTLLRSPFWAQQQRQEQLGHTPTWQARLYQDGTRSILLRPFCAPRRPHRALQPQPKEKCLTSVDSNCNSPAFAPRVTCCTAAPDLRLWMNGLPWCQKLEVLESTAKSHDPRGGDCARLHLPQPSPAALAAPDHSRAFTGTSTDNSSLRVLLWIPSPCCMGLLRCTSVTEMQG